MDGRVVGDHIWRAGPGRPTIAERWRRIEELPRERWTTADRAFAKLAEAYVDICAALAREAKSGNVKAIGLALGELRERQPIAVEGAVNHAHQHRVVNITLSERRPAHQTRALPAATAFDQGDAMLVAALSEIE